MRAGNGTMELRGSIFCEVRETVGFPTCVFYAAAIEEFLQRFEIGAEAQVSRCKGTGDANCTMTVRILGERLAERAAAA